MLNGWYSSVKVWLAWGTAGVLLLLPWQTRWIFGNVLLDGHETAFGILSVHVVEVLVMFMACAALVVYRHDLRARFQKLAGPAGLFAAAVLVSTVMSPWPVIAWHHVAHIVVAILLFALLSVQSHYVKRFMIAFVAGLYIPVLFGVIQVVTGAFPASTVLGIASRLAARPGDVVVMIHGARVLRAYGSFSHPNIFGGYLSVGILLLVGMWEAWQTRAERIFFYASLAVLGGGLALTMSKSAALGTFVALLIGYASKFLRDARGWRTSTGVVMMFTVLLLVIILTLSPRLVGNSLEANSVTERLGQWAAYPQLFSWLGSGPGTYVFHWFAVDRTQSWWLYQPMHHTLALVASEIGVLGLVAVLWGLYTIERRNRKELPVVTAIAGIMAVTSLFTIGLFDHYLWSLWQGLALSAVALSIAWTSGVFVREK